MTLAGLASAYQLVALLALAGSLWFFLTAVHNKTRCDIVRLIGVSVIVATIWPAFLAYLVGLWALKKCLDRGAW